MSKRKTAVALAAVVVLAVLILALAGCGSMKGDAPEPAPGNIRNGTNTQVIKMPNGFRNIAFTCSGTTGIYVTSRGVAETDPQASGVAVLANDPKCGSR